MSNADGGGEKDVTLGIEIECFGGEFGKKERELIEEDCFCTKYRQRDTDH